MIKDYNLTTTMTADCRLPVIDGEDKSENNPLYRATAKLFKVGKPIKSLSKCFLADNSGLLRWIGVFVQSAGDRILFFPGISDELKNIKSIRDTKIVLDEPFDLDHLSLEANRSEWHITSRGGIHRRGPNVIFDEQKRGFWFGMSIQNDNVFRIVKKRTEFYWEPPVKDTERRVENFCSLIKNEHTVIIKINNEIESEDVKRFSKRKNFIYFVVLVGPSGFDNQLKIEQYLPWNDPSLKTPLPKDIRMPCSLHRIHLSEDTDLQITSCLLPGELEFPISLRGFFAQKKSV